MLSYCVLVCSIPLCCCETSLQHHKILDCTLWCLSCYFLKTLHQSPPKSPTLKVVLEKDEVLLNGLVRAKFQDEAQQSHKVAHNFKKPCKTIDCATVETILSNTLPPHSALPDRADCEETDPASAFLPSL